MVMRRWIGRRAWITVGSVGIYCAAGRKDIKGGCRWTRKDYSYSILEEGPQFASWELVRRCHGRVSSGFTSRGAHTALQKYAK